MKRVVKRDLNERGKSKKQAEDDFLKSWDIYYEKFNNKSIKNNLNEFTIKKRTNIFSTNFNSFRFTSTSRCKKNIC